MNEVERFIQKIIQVYQLPDSMHGHFMLTICESVNNAIYHGNRNSQDKKVDIIVEDINNQIVISISDEGKGFNHKAVPDPTSIEHIKKERGRGLFLIKNLADDVSFSNNGSTINIKFNFNSEHRLLLRRD